jgi:5-methylcytosine-specific restriction protein A
MRGYAKFGGLAPTLTPKPLAQFQIGKLYKRKSDIHIPFGGNAQSGIAPSIVADAVFLFTSDTGEQFGYKDGPGTDGNGAAIYRYTGEGQRGDMQFTKGNKAIRDHTASGRALHLFSAVGKGKGKGHEYLGEFAYAGHERQGGQLDREGNFREIIVFQLVPVSVLVEVDNFEDTFEFIDTEPMTLDEARALAIAASSGDGPTAMLSAVRTVYTRSADVKRYVLMRAAGICESCRQPAPFERLNGSPYLEPHHTTRLSDGGADHPRFVGAICPACHREIHHGKNGVVKNAALTHLLLKKERT